VNYYTIFNNNPNSSDICHVVKSECDNPEYVLETWASLNGYCSPGDTYTIQKLDISEVEVPKVYPPGLYKVYWKGGGSSLAAIGMTIDGKNWIAPTNWTDDDKTLGVVTTSFNSVDYVKNLWLNRED